MTAEEHLDEVKKLATARLKACVLAAKHERLALVDAVRFDRLEALVVALKEATKTVLMTRDYKDMIEAGKTVYVGKKYLFERDKMNDVFRVLNDVDKFADLPLDCFAGGD